MSDGSTPEHEEDREFNRKFDERIEAHNSANQREFRALRDGQLTLRADIENLETNLTEEIRGVRTASETAHTQILSTLDEINARLD